MLPPIEAIDLLLTRRVDVHLARATIPGKKELSDAETDALAQHVRDVVMGYCPSADVSVAVVDDLKVDTIEVGVASTSPFQMPDQHRNRLEGVVGGAVYNHLRLYERPVEHSRYSKWAKSSASRRDKG